VGVVGRKFQVPPGDFLFWRVPLVVCSSKKPHGIQQFGSRLGAENQLADRPKFVNIVV